jgi:radical SAM protein with 4Fe4S-binding SPASM domain
MEATTDMTRRDGLFSMVEIEINSHCNRACWYCPNSVAPRDAPKLMREETFEIILGRLRDVGFAGRVSYHFYGEPLLHPKLDGFVRRAAEVLPGVRQVLYSNGDLLTDARYERLLASGIEHFVVTYHDGVLPRPRPHVTMLTPKLLSLTNRGGLVPAGPGPAGALLCYAPSTMLIVTVTGNVVLCYEDARETVVLGNIVEQPVEEVWWGPRFVSLREALARGDRTRTDICRRCNNCAHLEPTTFDYVL